MPGWLVSLLLVATLVLTGWAAWQLWHELEGVTIGMHGQIALALGGGFSLLVTVLFMVLIYVSRSRGFDDRAGRSDDDDRLDGDHR
jgi:type VI protein secretion system component VasK